MTRAILGAVLIMAASTTALAQPRGEAERRFERAVELFDRGDFEAALSEFQASYRERAVPSVLLNIALTQRALDRPGDAIATLRSYLAAEDPRLTPARRRQIEREIHALEAGLSTLEISVVPAGADVLIDGRLVDASIVLALGVGEHEIVVRRDGYAEERQTVQLRGREHRELRIVLVEEAGASATLVVRSQPSGASALIDGADAGTTPLERRLAAGGHRVHLSLEGTGAVEREIVLVAGEREEITIDLSGGGASVLEEAWLWVLVGVALAAGAVAIGVGATLPSGGPVAPQGTLYTFP